MSSVIILSDIALEQIHNELARYSDLETGGILLGKYCGQGVWRVESSVSPDSKAVRTDTSFEFEGAEMEERILQAMETEREDCEMLGIWHRHNNMFEPVFSQEDDAVNAEYAKACGGRALSILVQTQGEEERFTAYVVNSLGESILIEIM